MSNTDKTAGGNRSVAGKDDRSQDATRTDRRGREETRQEQAADSHPEEDPAEGSRQTVEHELDRLDRSGRSASQSAGEGQVERAREELRKQVSEETQLPGRGSA
ncbi:MULTISPECIES: hypothetical protein [unclassified Mesorhizobium]|uniref:hypothetical protein n=1 Tax=unclassified Mesorhizobium TaxID=325217 RepID=UPI001125CE11|nr:MULTISPECIES: hypothetical protein [unclassified Mesorhizobium]MBZ9702708.1 hypothetical protein [Mesorhizobium sp. CO1-1-3]MBZ9897486.1 hypothetical protein [Mesorhizobium sp. BR1-1-6]MBZ9917145.1 hypothetical protein [Mesorhizobium sp. BR1-1-7]MBZ9948574.1 hypothetical protein [Mesorhizobium sp. BR1-1-11]MBZ9951791.1 hypothetical protein [Mesorhizobium sp. BR1-1-15]